ncbi:ornithine--oxo-acid transaminase [Gordonia sp. SID5947]|uniref:ornithine--oxo-acid transaminase n=1 Tax=Gordonia sp. SID5947 TaxID=2690315 RepID=UPI0013722089|nr:ornithine--oxo-acid transaminase [Gordonia sp. SID5947]MYR06300.1 ornithine--oxo-acid transaminase [Gordonia sp. SID5947]
MTLTSPALALPVRTSRLRTYAMTPPVHFTVAYTINPWMDPSTPVDSDLAIAQWRRLRAAYQTLGHTVRVVDPHPDLPDMVYAANGGLSISGHTVAARFAFPERGPEGDLYAAWLEANGLGPVHRTVGIQEGEGDFLVVGERILAGTGFRSHRDTHAEIASITGMPVVTLELIDPRFYHLDTALGVLDDENIAYYPPAFSPASQTLLAELYPEAIVATDSDAAVLGLNLVSDGRHVVMTDAAPRLARSLRTAGYQPVEIDLSELLKGGGGIKCCTLELRGTDKEVVMSSPATVPAASPPAEPHVAQNYSPLPVTAATAEGCWITDVDGRRFLDCLGAYSAVNFGHRNPRIVAAATAQLDRITLTSRAFRSDRLEPFCAALSALCDKDMVLPMNTGAEAVESAIKVARKWGYDVKGVPAGQAKIVVADGNFHGRTVTIVSFSDDPVARDGFGPYTPGFVRVPYGDATAIASAVDENTVAVLLEPIQGEAGIIVPPDDYLRRVRSLCTEHDVLMIADEIQSGLGRTGTTLAVQHWDVEPDIYTLGKALGGGILPVSAVVADREVLGVLHPGEHGSTFGGNPLAAAVGHTVVDMLAEGTWQARAAELGDRLHTRLRDLIGHGVVAVRGLGLWAGIDVEPSLGSGKDICVRLAGRGILAKDTHGSTLRLAPPLVITEAEIDWAVDQLAEVVGSAG